MSVPEPEINGHHEEDDHGVREASQAPPSPELRKRAEPEEFEIRQRVASNQNINPNEAQDEDFPTETTAPVPLEGTKKVSPTKSFEQLVHEDDLKKKRSTPDPTSSAAPAESKNKSHIWVQEVLVNLKWKNIICFGMTFLVAIIMGFYFSQNKTDVHGVKVETVRSWKHSRNFLLRNVTFLKERFGAQKEETWIQMLAAVNSTLSDHEPKQPSAIVLLLPPAVTREFSTCFVKKLAETVNDAHNVRNSNNNQETKRVSAVKEMGPDYFAQSDTVTYIHDDLKEYLRREKAVIFYDVDRIQREEHLLVFHGFCDSSQAYDKRATYFFIISVPQDVLEQFEWTHSNGEEIAQSVLNSAWKDALSDDKRPAVISRILANILLVNNGDICQ